MRKLRGGFMMFFIPLLIIEPAISAAVLYILPLLIMLSIVTMLTVNRIQMLNYAILITSLYLIGLSAEELIIKLIAIIFIIFTLISINI
ncbi:hypothetical protein [Jeotgalibacillus salarius]|uniref:Uncharacterized protein n=1 Tax=Jeotgalibacillus salarius TaxID=546023 RepID=A0A4Y8L645_9BACL|nr:hypothetical protein [Jeotgalibacillus salarius]TFD97731.1 hypothetical protein E2626_16395 [Jeotgalibacillus salarius]